MRDQDQIDLDGAEFIDLGVASEETEGFNPGCTESEDLQSRSSGCQ